VWALADAVLVNAWAGVANSFARSDGGKSSGLESCSIVIVLLYCTIKPANIARLKSSIPPPAKV